MRERSARAKMLAVARREAVVKAFLCTPRVLMCIAPDIVRIGCDRTASKRVVHQQGSPIPYNARNDATFHVV